MTNEEMLLRAILGEPLPEDETFHPQTNEQAYLAYAVGLIEEQELLPPPRTHEEVLLKEYCLNGGGGVELPELTNPAGAYDIVLGKEAIDQNGDPIVGKLDAGAEWYIDSARSLFAGGNRINALRELLAKCKDVTSCEFMFDGSEVKINFDLDLSGFDTSKVTTMSNMFSDCRYMTGIIGLDKFDTSNLSDATNMFRNCLSIEDLSAAEKFNTGNLTSATNMFYGCYKISALDLSGWDTSKLRKVNGMFSGCSNLTDLILPGLVGPTTTDVNQMFYGCKLLEVLDSSGWDTSNTNNMSYMFYDCASLPAVEMHSWDTSKTTNMTSMFNGCNNLRAILGFSAMNKAGMSIAFPYGSSAAAPMALNRLTFRTDLPEGQYAIRSAINIKHCNFTRDGMVEMFNTLTDVSGMSHSSSYKQITITGNPCVSEKFSLNAITTFSQYYSLDELRSALNKRYRGYDYSGATICYYLTGQSSSQAVEGTIDNITDEMFANGPISALFRADTITIPEADKLTDADRAIATSKGWTLVE